MLEILQTITLGTHLLISQVLLLSEVKIFPLWESTVSFSDNHL